MSKDTAAVVAPKKNLLTILRDGWNSVISGLGQAGYDKRANTSVNYNPLMDIDAEELYGADDIAAKIVDELPEAAFREGFELSTADGDKDKQKGIINALDVLETNDRFEEAWKWARMYGGAGIVVITDRLQDLADPLDENNIGQIKALQVFSKYELIWNEIDLDIRNPTFGLPKSYRLQPRALAAPASVNIIIHASRIIRFDGVKVPRRIYVQNQYWHDSVLTRAQDAIKNYKISHDGVATALQDFSVAKYKMKNLAEMVASGDSNAVLTRMQTVALTRSIARAVVIDADNEDFEYQARNMTGIPEVLNSTGNRLVAASKMPHTQLLGESPDGSNATGNSTTLQWYDYVGAQQEQYLKKKLMRLINLVCKSKRGPTGGKVPDGLEIIFRPLWQQNSKDEASTRLNVAQADQIYVDMGAVDPLEVGKSRFGSGKYSMETQIDMDVRERMAVDLGSHDESQDETAAVNKDPAQAQNPQLVDPKTKAKATKRDDDDDGSGLDQPGGSPDSDTEINEDVTGNPGDMVPPGEIKVKGELSTAMQAVTGDVPAKLPEPGKAKSDDDMDEEEWAEMLGHLFDGKADDLAVFKGALATMKPDARAMIMGSLRNKK